ncbi:MAG TPA: alanine racemase, partial [Thermoanaerobaculia bacterium]
TRAIVDLDAIAANYRLLEAAAGGPGRVLPVVKADAYGHGAVEVSRRLELEGAPRFAVAFLEEASALRAAGIRGDILLLSSGDPEDVAELAAQRIAPVLHDLAQARRMADAAAGLAAPLPVHLKLDTGMGRLGIRPEHVAEAAALLRGSRGLSLAGTFTQFACADDPRSPATGRQIRAFEDALGILRAAGLDPGLVHASNSAGTLHFPAARFDAVRPGLALYGIEPSGAQDDDRRSGLRPALSLESRVMAIRRVPAGTPLGYGAAFVTRRTTDVAVLPIGYHDGLRRSFSGRSSVLLRGARAPVVGAVSMDLTLVDATDTGAEPGDVAVILGRSGAEEIGAWELARAAGTNPYEILCGIGARVPREYVP